MRTIQIITAALAAFTATLVSAGDPVNTRISNELIQYDNVVPPPGPVQPGASVEKCGAWALAAPGVTCHSLALSLGLDERLFKSLNPQLKGDCPKNLWAGYYYCKGLARHKPNVHTHTHPHHPKITRPPPPPPADCLAAALDKCASAILTASETPGPMVDWCKRYLAGPICTEQHPEGIFSLYDKFPRQADASTLCAYPSAPPMAPRFSTACMCFTQLYQ